MLNNPLRALTARQKLVAALFLCDHWPIARIAKKLGVGTSAVDRLLYRARRGCPALRHLHRAPPPRRPREVLFCELADFDVNAYSPSRCV